MVGVWHHSVRNPRDRGHSNHFGVSSGTYCYLPNRSDKGRMGFDVLEKVFTNVFGSDFLGERLRICWHAGEPTTLPVSYYREAFSIIDRLKPASLKAAHEFQTNAILLDSDWCGLLKERTDLSMGVSLDGPKHIHDRGHSRLSMPLKCNRSQEMPMLPLLSIAPQAQT